MARRTKDGFGFRPVSRRRKLPGMSDTIFRYSQRVTYADCAPGNHVYYANYLLFLEAARGEFFRTIGITFLQLQNEGTVFPVVECRLRYKAPARYDEVIVVELWVTAAERVRLNFAYRILDAAGNLLVEAETQHVCTGLDEKAKRLPEELIARTRAYLRT